MITLEDGPTYNDIEIGDLIEVEFKVRSQQIDPFVRGNKLLALVLEKTKSNVKVYPILSRNEKGDKAMGILGSGPDSFFWLHDNPYTKVTSSD